MDKFSLFVHNVVMKNTLVNLDFQKSHARIMYHVITSWLHMTVWLLGQQPITDVFQDTVPQQASPPVSLFVTPMEHGQQCHHI